MIESVLLKTPLNTTTGYGVDGCSLARALEEFGFDVRLRPISLSPPIPMDAAKMLTRPYDLNFDYLVHHADPASLGLSEGEKKLARKKVAWSMFEFSSLSSDAADGLVDRLRGYDELLVYDEVSAQAFRPHADAAKVPMAILQGGYWSREWQFDPRLRDWSGPFRFCMVGALHQRKDPFAAIYAFAEVAKHFERGEVELHLKTNMMGLHPKIEEWVPGVKIHYDLWSKEQLQAFYASCHCYVAPSWGEGKNLPALEAQSMGIPVIYSDIGGHRQWGGAEWGWPVGGTMEEHEPGMASLRVDRDELAKAMLDAAQNRAQTRQKGELAARMIPAQCDWEKVLHKLATILHRY